MAKCKFCNDEITWVKEGRKNIPVESDGKIHECEQYIQMRNSTKKYNRDDLADDILKEYQDKINEEAVKRSK